MSAPIAQTTCIGWVSNVCILHPHPLVVPGGRWSSSITVCPTPACSIHDRLAGTCPPRSAPRSCFPSVASPDTVAAVVLTENRVSYHDAQYVVCLAVSYAFLSVVSFALVTSLAWTLTLTLRKGMTVTTLWVACALRLTHSRNTTPAAVPLQQQALGWRHPPLS